MRRVEQRQNNLGKHEAGKFGVNAEGSRAREGYWGEVWLSDAYMKDLRTPPEFLGFGANLGDFGCLNWFDPIFVNRVGGLKCLNCTV